VLLLSLRVLQMLVRQAAAEMIGTFMIIFVGGGSIVLSERYPQVFPAVSIPIAWGVTIALMILAVGHISGAHFNPAVTLAFAATKKFPMTQIFTYWSSQFIGGLVAISLLEVFKRI
jgi:aquaporin NIP